MVEPGGRGPRRAACSATPGPPWSWPTCSTRTASQAAKEIGATYIHLDVTSEEEWDAVIAEVIETHGRLDVMVNNAGIFRRGQLVNLSLEEWQQVISVNQTGVFLGMRAAAKAMIAAGNGGSIINISSVAGLQGTFGSIAYSASKWAVRGMTKVAAKELGRHGIRVNSIHPGLIDTAMTADFPAMVDEEQRAADVAAAPRWAGSARRPTSPTWPCSWPATPAATARARSSWSTAASTAESAG